MKDGTENNDKINTEQILEDEFQFKCNFVFVLPISRHFARTFHTNVRSNTRSSCDREKC